jgi:endonuclease YncB( thermonuclease family)
MNCARHFIYLMLMSLLLISFYPNILHASEIQVKVVRILDGDTFDALHGQYLLRVRMSNIDAPEKTQSFGQWSLRQLKDMLAGHTVTVVYTHTDPYGRILGQVITASGIDANRQQVITGAAWVYERYNTDYALPGIQTQARKDRRGLWVEKHPIEPWIWRKNQKMKDNN